jgi:glucosamine--fructose-6-phosphate aminotransferase (isomerizing)
MRKVMSAYLLIRPLARPPSRPADATLARGTDARIFDRASASGTETSDVPAERFPGLEATDFGERSLYETLATRFGVRPVRARETFEPVLMTRAQAAEPGGSSMTTPETIEALHEAMARTTAWQEASIGGPAVAAALAVARGAPDGLVRELAEAGQVVVTGAGSSLYIAQVAVAAMRAWAGLPALAVPLSELLLRPEGVLAASDLARQPIIVVSRSGSTTEALEVVGAAKARGQRTLAVTCRPESPMALLADATLAVPEGDEEAIVMTRSFAAQSALLMRLAARAGSWLGRDVARSIESLEAVPGRWADLGSVIERALELALTDPSRVIVLGGGAAFGLANEAVLKLTETSQVPASAFHPLEFRHGPISVCEPGVLVVGLLGGPAESAERRVVEESAALGATTWVLGPEGPGADLDETARLLLHLHVLQALALGVAARRGRDPDAPRHLGQVVVIAKA